MRNFHIILCLLLVPTAFIFGQTTVTFDDQNDIVSCGLEDYNELPATAARQDIPATISSDGTSSYFSEVIQDSSRFAAQEMMPVSVEPIEFSGQKLDCADDRRIACRHRNSFCN